MLWICCSSAETRRLIKVQGKLDAAKRKEILQENISMSAELNFSRTMILNSEDMKVNILHWPRFQPKNSVACENMNHKMYHLSCSVCKTFE